MPNDAPKKPLTIRDLYPDLTEDQLKEVEETLHNYASIAWRIFERLEREAAGGLEEPNPNRRIKEKVDSPKQTNPTPI